MSPLLETAIGFVAIMLVLSFLVKSLTSVVKNHVDLYSRNLRHEVYALVQGTLNISQQRLETMLQANRTQFPFLAHHLKRLGEEYFTKQNIEWVLQVLAANNPVYCARVTAALTNLEGRLAVHLGNVNYMFERRMKNVTLIAGLVLCLGLNINGFRIWQTLYTDQQLRATFSTEYAEKAIALTTPEETSAGQPPSVETK